MCAHDDLIVTGAKTLNSSKETTELPRNSTYVKRHMDNQLWVYVLTVKKSKSLSEECYLLLILNLPKFSTIIRNCFANEQPWNVPIELRPVSALVDFEQMPLDLQCLEVHGCCSSYVRFLTSQTSYMYYKN